MTAPYPVELYPGCPCSACDAPADGSYMRRMALCPACGNKRCPGAANHTNACSGTNEPGQDGSNYPAPNTEPRDAQLPRTWPHVAEMPPIAGTDPKLANDIARIVSDLFGGYAPFSVRYGIAHAILHAGYTKENS